MDMLPSLLGLAVLLPLFSFWLIFIVGRRLGEEGSAAAIIATSDPALADRLDAWRAALSASVKEAPEG